MTKPDDPQHTTEQDYLEAVARAFAADLTPPKPRPPSRGIPQFLPSAWPEPEEPE